MAVREIKDFSRGYSTDLLPDDIPDNMAQQAINVYQDKGLKKRKGYKTIYENATEDASIVGHYFYLMGAVGVTFIALEVSDVIRFYTNYSGSMVEVDSSFTWSGSGPVRAAVIDGELVLVDASATNIPAIIYLDTTLKITTLDDYDSRVIDDPFWYAGQYVDGEDFPYLDDTVDAQSVDTADFALSTTTNNDGFYIASAKKFSKVVLKTAGQFTGSPVASYQYFDGDDWQTLTLGTTPVWTAAAGDRTMEFDIPEDWDVWRGDDSVDSGGDTVPGGMTGTYAIRIRFTTATIAVNCSYLEVSQTKSVTFALNNENPIDVLVHNSRVFLIAGNSVNYSLYGQSKGFEAYYAEYFEAGGPAIRRALSAQQALYIIKDEAIHRMTGTSPEDFSIGIVANKGTPYGETCAVCKSLICFSDGEQLFVYDGSSLMGVGSHVKSDIPSTAYGAASLDRYWLVASDRILVFDPEALVGSSGQYSASVYRFTNDNDIRGIVRYLGVNQFSDTGIYDRIVGYVNGTAKLICLEYGSQYFDETDTTVPITLETKMFSFGVQTEKKAFKRIKAIVSQSGDWILTIQSRRDADTITVTLVSGTGGDYYEQDISLPYTVDSSTLSFKFENDTVNDCKLFALSMDLELRAY